MRISSPGIAEGCAEPDHVYGGIAESPGALSGAVEPGIFRSRHGSADGSRSFSNGDERGSAAALGGSENYGGPETFRIHRTMLDADSAKKTSSAGSREVPVSMTLLVTPNEGKDRGMALDASAVLGHKYEYWIERLIHDEVGGKPVEIVRRAEQPDSSEREGCVSAAAPGSACCRSRGGAGSDRSLVVSKYRGRFGGICCVSRRCGWKCRAHLTGKRSRDCADVSRYDGTGGAYVSLLGECGGR